MPSDTEPRLFVGIYEVRPYRSGWGIFYAMTGEIVPSKAHCIWPSQATALTATKILDARGPRAKGRTI